MKTRSIAVVAGALLTACFALPGAARADCCVEYDYGDAASNTADIDKTTTNGLADFENQFITGLKGLTGQMSGNIKQRSHASANSNQTQDDMEAKRRVTDAITKAQVDGTSGATTCNVITGGVSGQAIEAQVAAWREQLIQAELDRDKGSAGSQGGVAGAGSPQNAMLAQRQTAHCTVGGDMADVVAGYCANAVSPQNAGRDLNASVLLNPTVAPASPGQPAVDAHLTLSQDDEKAVATFLDTALLARPFGPLPVDTARTEAGRGLLAARNSSIARNSVALSLGAALAADRVPMDTQVVSGGGTGGSGTATTTLRKWAEGTAQQTLGYDNSSGSYFPNGVSRDAWQELRAKSWFMNPNWAKAVDTNTSANPTFKDMALIKSYQVYQGWERYRRLEDVSMAMATWAASLEARNRDRAVTR
jgi:hypothetical protein